MATITSATGRTDTMADLIEQLGGIPPARILMRPTPGTAVEADVIATRDRDGRLCELVDGVLVEKTMGAGESGYAAWIVFFLIDHLRKNDLGQALTTDAVVRLLPGQIRLPDACFISWARYPKGGLGPIADLAPDLAVEILSKGNTKREMDRKLRDYFRAGVRLVWYVDPRKRTARVYTSPDRSTLLREADELDGGDVLPGFQLPLRTWFDEASRSGPRGA